LRLDEPAMRFKHHYHRDVHPSVLAQDGKLSVPRHLRASVQSQTVQGMKLPITARIYDAEYASSLSAWPNSSQQV